MERKHAITLRLDKSAPLGEGFKPVLCRCLDCVAIGERTAARMQAERDPKVLDTIKALTLK